MRYLLWVTQAESIFRKKCKESVVNVRKNMPSPLTVNKGNKHNIHMKQVTHCPEEACILKQT